MEWSQENWSTLWATSVFSLLLMATLRSNTESFQWAASFCWPSGACLTSIQSGVCCPLHPFCALAPLHSECFGLTSNASCWGVFLSVFFTMKCAPACCRYLANRSKRHTLAMTNPTAEIPPDLQRQLGQQPFRSRVWPPHLVPDQHRWVATWAMGAPGGPADRPLLASLADMMTSIVALNSIPNFTSSQLLDSACTQGHETLLSHYFVDVFIVCSWSSWL